MPSGPPRWRGGAVQVALEEQHPATAVPPRRGRARRDRRRRVLHR
jgi:hypothetical protein